MGIRFECPQGHRLHVKAFLAGERGICPECDARFIVPAESGGRASALEEVAASPEIATSPTAATASIPTTPIDLAAPKLRRTRRRSRRDRAKTITIALSALVLLLLMALVWVLSR